MACLLCNSFQGKGPLPTEEEYFEGNAITRHIKQDGIAWSSFLESAATCYCCEILRKGVMGCLSQHGMGPATVESIDVEFYYQSREGADEDSNKTITCCLVYAKGERTEFQVEFFTLDEPDCPCPEAWEYVPISVRTSAGTRSEAAFEKARE